MDLLPPGGLLADSLPDRYGNAVIDAWLAGQGRAARWLPSGRGVTMTECRTP